MNLREGRVGKQETASLAWIACMIQAVFAISTQSAYEDGNAIYAATFIAAALSLLLFFCIVSAMRRCGCASLSALYDYAFGGVGAYVASLLTACVIAYAAALPLARMLQVLGRYIFISSPAGSISLYFLAVVLLLALAGFESISRTAKLFWIVVLLAFVIAVLIASPAFETYRLYPLLGGSARLLARQSLTGTARFLPALLALLICGRGVQGAENAWRGGLIGVSGAAIAASLVQFCLGMTYSYQTLAGMHAPVYRMTMAVRTGGAYLRTDKLLLFGWIIGVLIACAFLCYSCGLLYTRAARMRDVRPAAAVFATLVVTLALLGEVDETSSEYAANFFFNVTCLLLAVPPLVASAVAWIKKEVKPS